MAPAVVFTPAEASAPIVNDVPVIVVGPFRKLMPFEIRAVGAAVTSKPQTPGIGILVPTDSGFYLNPMMVQFHNTLDFIVTKPGRI